MKKIITVSSAVILLGFSFLSAQECPHHSKNGSVKTENSEVAYSNLPKAGKSVKLPDGNEFTWEFNNKVKLGPNVLSVSINDQKNLNLKNYTVKANLDMPSMKGAHSSGSKKLNLNKKNNFVGPYDFVMRGDWEICIEIFYNDKPIYKGKYIYNI